MKTFQDIMRENPSVVTQNTNTHIGSTDTLCRWYNMWWGALTNTHMQLMDDGTYIVIGSRLSKNLWDDIMYSRKLSNTLLPHIWSEVMTHNNLDYAFTSNNGSFAIAIAHKEIKDEHGEPYVKSIEIPITTTITSTPYGYGDTYGENRI